MAEPLLVLVGPSVCGISLWIDFNFSVIGNLWVEIYKYILSGVKLYRFQAETVLDLTNLVLVGTKFVRQFDFVKFMI